MNNIRNDVKSPSSQPKKIDFNELALLKVPSNELSACSKGSPYIICNEQQQDQTIQGLKMLFAKDAKLPTVHIGFSLWFNLDLLSETNMQYAILFDIDKNVLALYQLIHEILKDNAINTPEKFLHALFDRLKTDKENLSFYPIEYLEEELAKQLRQPTGFLSSVNNFLKVKNMFQEGKIFYGHVDLTDVDKIQQVSNWCKKNNLKIATLYISNIPEWIVENKKTRKDQLIQSITLLTQDDTMIIDAFYPTTQKKGSGPPQRMCLAKTFNSDRFKKTIAKGYFNSGPSNLIDSDDETSETNKASSNFNAKKK